MKIVMSTMKMAVGLVACAMVLLVVSCNSAPKTDGLVAEYRYGMTAGDSSGYTFYRFYNNNTFMRGAYGKSGSKTGEIVMEHGTYLGSAVANGTLTLTVTSTLNALNGEWLSSNSSDMETGTISGNVFSFNGITYTRYSN